MRLGVGFSMGAEREKGHAAHEGFVVEDHAFAGAHRGRRACEISEDEEGLAPHLLALGSNDVDDLAVRREEGKELGAQLVLVYFVIKVVDIEGGIGLVRRGGHGCGWIRAYALFRGQLTYSHAKFNMLQLASLLLPGSSAL